MARPATIGARELKTRLFLQRQLARPVPFVAFDGRLVQAARVEGLTVITAPGQLPRKAAKAIRMVKRAGVGKNPVPGDESPSGMPPRRSRRQMEDPTGETR